MSKKHTDVDFITDELAVLQHGIIVSMAQDPSDQLKKKKKITRADSPKPKVEGTGVVAMWGEGNDYPQDVIELANQDLELLPLLDKKGRLLQGREVIAVNLVWDEQKKDFNIERIDDPEINGFLSNRRTQRYWRESCVDFTWFHNFFADLIKDVEGDKIVYIGTHAAEDCRWGKMNDKGIIEMCYVSSYWPSAKPEEKDKVMGHPVLDPYSYTVVEDLRENTKHDRVVWPSSYPTPGQAYYQNAPWHKYLFSDWSKIKALVPKWKVKLMDKVLSARFILSIPVNYWPTQHKDWHKLDYSQRLEIKKAKVREIDGNLTGLNGVGRTILTETGTDQEGKEIPALKLTPIDGSTNIEGKTEDSQEASQYMMRSLDLDPTIVGNGPGRGKDAGSGSDKRVAFNILVALLQPYRDVILEPLYFIAEYNGWLKKYPNLRFKVLEVELETLDKAHSTSVINNPVTKSENENN
ncbi:hypothetical protein [Pedobacter antarcticus]|uniref:hypothetical protein n=1 Tax=Pedobacter antarcticus TaxID=34086 RepID=UPI00292E6A42|nr:hypothetical protein [Pedobacter antarcticus]